MFILILEAVTMAIRLILWPITSLIIHVGITVPKMAAQRRRWGKGKK